MKYIMFGRVVPERANVWLKTQVWILDGGGSVSVSCDASQITINADLPAINGYVDAFMIGEQVAEAVFSVFGFALGTGYSVEILQVVTEAGECHTFGVRFEGYRNSNFGNQFFYRRWTLQKRTSIFGWLFVTTPERSGSGWIARTIVIAQWRRSSQPSQLTKKGKMAG